MLPAAPTRVSGLALFIADGSAVVAVSVPGIGVISICFSIGNEKYESRSESGAQRTYTTQQQCKNVEQAFGCSGDQCFLGHRFVPRIGLFAPDDSTNGGRAMHRRLARLAGALIPAFDWEELHAVGY